MNLCIDSKKIKPGDIFFCIKGDSKDGHNYAASAAENGAKIIIYQDAIPDKKFDGVTYIKVKDTTAALGEACDSFFGHPSHKLKMFGVTGTNGKSTICSIISQVYSAYEPCGYIGTISMKIGEKTTAPDLTTPDAITLHRTLKEMLENGDKAASIEVSSQGLSRGRVDTIDFDYAIFTNLTHDHLDYYGTMENYFEAKKLLFKNLKPEATAVLNKDSYTYEELCDCCPCRHLSYSLTQDADYMARNIHYEQTSASFRLLHKGASYNVHTNLTADYNISNLLSAVAVLHEAGMPIEDIIKAVKHINQIPGRMERIEEGQNFEVIVDYAHTPDGFEHLFRYAKKITPKKSRIIGVFGAAGGRDTTKRKTFGELASKYCDKVFLTEQDIRNESALDISNQIIEGITDLDYTFIEKRDEAIKAAIHSANEGDRILIMGKGDETFTYDENGRIPWAGDKNVAKEALLEILNK